MTYQQFRECFPFFAEWLKPQKDGLRLRALRMIPRDDLIVISKLAEMVNDKTEFSIEHLKWMYLFAEDKERKKIIDGYRIIIEEINTGKLEVC